MEYNKFKTIMLVKKQLLLLIMILLPMVAVADESGKCGDNLTWTYTETTQTLTIEGTGAMTDYRFPSDIPWNPYKSNIEKILIGPGVTTICNYAFYEYASTNYIYIPNSVRTIGYMAFYDCHSLTSITIPNSVTSISSYAFASCTGLNSVTIGNSVTSIGAYAFAYCSALISVTIGNSVMSIGENAFSSCSSLTSVSIGSGVTSIGESAFYGCTGLSSIVVESGNTVYDSRDNCNALIVTSSNSLILGCENTVIPNSVTNIGYGAFANCSGLTSVIIPNSVISINGGAFRGCSGLSSIVVESGNTVYDSRDNCNAIIETASNTMLYGCKNTIIPQSVTSIGNYAFYGCSDLTSVTIPNSVTSFGEGAFEYCSGLTTITIPNSVASIGRDVFYGCSSLTSINIGSGMTSIGSGAFNLCSSLEKVIVPDIAAWCGIKFSWSDANPLCYAHHLYSDEKTEIKDLVIPNSVTNLGQYAFIRCSSLTSVTIPNSVTSIGDYAFSGCTGLTSIIIGSGVATIGEGVFHDCTGLLNVYCYAEQIPTTDSYTFFDTPISQASLHVPASVLIVYQALSPWKNFGTIVALTDNDPKPDVTGISVVRDIEDNKDVIYNLNGIRLNEPQKGINIINGKKYVVK